MEGNRRQNHRAADLGFDRSGISKNALEVVKKLQSSGYDGYLVGGCVRDLILGREPKDFDVTTNASPEKIKKLFDRAKIIGRRFKLVHIAFGRGREREIIEVATYRALPKPGNKKRFRGAKNTTNTGRIIDDNVFGTIDMDAIRRDFAINALYYDPVKETVIDFVNGIDDARKKVLRVIGDQDTRFTEDPVRMLRVVRFQAKLDLKVPADTMSAVERNAVLIDGVPAARLFEEVLKLFHYGAAQKTWKCLRQTNLFKHLFPQTLNSIDSGQEQFESLILIALGNTDKRVRKNQPVIPGFLFAVLLWQPFKFQFESLKSSGMRANEALWEASDRVFRKQSQSVTIPFRVRGPAQEMWEMQTMLQNRVPKTIHRLLENRRFRAAYDFLIMRGEIDEVNEEVVKWWTDIQDRDIHQKNAMIEKLRGESPSKNRRPRK